MKKKQFKTHDLSHGFRRMRYFVILLLFCNTRSQAQTWSLVWSDEFDSSSIDASNWTYDVGGDGWGNSELEYYTNLPENATVKDGNLLIIARHETFGGNNYTSARLKTEGLQSFTYGKIEARIKLPAGQGLWPAFWMLGNDISQVGWPKCGEIDIMEHINNVPIIYGTMHWDDNGHVSYGGQIECSSATDYHIYSIEWNADSIAWFLDGIKYCAGNITNNINSTDEFHLPFFIILNLAIGGTWPGSPDSTTAFPDTMFVDYVRVYQLATGINEGDGSKIPNHSVLEQNYPNPFNPSTVISYQLTVNSFVTLKVYNVLGSEVKTLVDARENTGNHSVIFDGSGLAGGVYFYRLQTGNSVETKESMLLK